MYTKLNCTKQRLNEAQSSVDWENANFNLKRMWNLLAKLHSFDDGQDAQLVLAECTYLAVHVLWCVFNSNYKFKSNFIGNIRPVITAKGVVRRKNLHLIAHLTPFHCGKLIVCLFGSRD